MENETIEENFTDDLKLAVKEFYCNEKFDMFLFDTEYSRGCRRRMSQ